LPTVIPAPAPDPVVSEPVVKEEPVVVEPVVVENVQVETQHGDVITRKQVAADGRTIEDVPVAEAPPRTVATRAPAPRAATTTTRRTSGPHFVVQVGAFSIEANAKALQERLTSIGQRAHIDKTSLYRVRIGPFATRDQAVAARTALEAKGISAIIVTE
jgi:cell division protein FtsN